jgi:hypothetical protein
MESSNMKRIALTLPCLSVLVLFSAVVLAQQPSEEEAKRFNQAMKRGEELARKRAYPQALSAFKDAVSAYPFGVDAYFSAGNIAFHLQKCRDALMYMSGFLALGGKGEDASDANQAIESCSKSVKAGQLAVSSVPEGIAVFVDGVFLGKTPITVGLQAGGYEVLLRDEDYEDSREKVQIKPLAKTVVEKTLSKKVFYGHLNVKTNPEEGVKVFVDDKEVGVTPIKEPLHLEAKKVVVRFECDGHESFVRAVQIPKNQTVTLEVTLEKSK